MSNGNWHTRHLRTSGESQWSTWDFWKIKKKKKTQDLKSIFQTVRWSPTGIWELLIPEIFFKIGLCVLYTCKTETGKLRKLPRVAQSWICSFIYTLMMTDNTDVWYVPITIESYSKMKDVQVLLWDTNISHSSRITELWGRFSHHPSAKGRHIFFL